MMRLEGLRAEGRRVVLVGDYNITYSPMDHCEPGPNFIDGRVDRQMLLGLLPPTGPFLDTFRVFQPDRYISSYALHRTDELWLHIDGIHAAT